MLSIILTVSNREQDANRESHNGSQHRTDRKIVYVSPSSIVLISSVGFWWRWFRCHMGCIATLVMHSFTHSHVRYLVKKVFPCRHLLPLHFCFLWALQLFFFKGAQVEIYRGRKMVRKHNCTLMSCYQHDRMKSAKCKLCFSEKIKIWNHFIRRHMAWKKE